MNINTPQNQSYWFVLREDQNNVVLSSNNFAVQTPQAAETRYIVDTGVARQYIQITEPVQTISCVDQPHVVPIEAPSVNQAKVETFWDRNKIKMLFNLSADTKYKHCDPCKDKFIWKEIAPILGTTPEECCKKYTNLKSTFIRVYKKKLLGKETKWLYFNMCEEAFKKYKFMSPGMLDTWDENKIRRLLILYIENFDKFHSPSNKKKDIWKEIGAALGTTDCSSYRKFRSLKRTYIKILERTRETGKMVKWPYHVYFQKIFSESNPRQWHKNKIKLLLEAYAERTHKFSSCEYRKKEIWREIANIVGESPSDCDKKFRNLKVTYLKLKSMELSGTKVTKWRYYKHFEEINNRTLQANSDESEHYFSRKYKVDEHIKQLLLFYIENKEIFRNPIVKKKLLWRTIGSKINLAPDECDKKFRNLKQTYLRLAEQKQRTGKDSDWPYFSYFEKIYDDDILTGQRRLPVLNLEHVMLSEIKKVVRDVQDQRENDQKFKRLIDAVEESNNIQRARNMILQALLDRNK